MDAFLVVFREVFPEATSQIVLGAVTGSMLFAVTSREHAALKKVILFGVSFVVGVFGAGEAGALLATVFPVELDQVLGAFLASAACVPAMLALFSRLEISIRKGPGKSSGIHRNQDDGISSDYPYSTPQEREPFE